MTFLLLLLVSLNLLRHLPPPAGLSKLPNFKRFNFASGLPNTLRQKFPPQAGLLFDGRPALSDAGFDLLSRLLDYCPVSCCCPSPLQLPC